MIRINLLPHRAEYRQKQILEYVVVFVVAVFIIIGLIVIVNTWASQDLTDLQEEKARLKAENIVLSKKIGELRNLDGLRKEVEAKLQIVDELQAGRFRSLKTLDAIVQAIPQNIWIENLNEQSNLLTLSGFGESSKAVANFMRALQLSSTFDDVSLVVDQEIEKTGVKVRSFSLSFRRLTVVEQLAKVHKEGE